ncbi:MAG: hypothetical protein HKP20_05305, partial [Akkermansiaceae bacterium]|nr:hypothetical protein [Akkermansiaceae bacterium]
MSVATSAAKEFKLTRNARSGNTLNLSHRAQIVSINKSRSIVEYTIWRNGSPYISVTGKDDVIGILPAGKYTLLVGDKQSVTIKLSTKIKPQTVTLWARATKITNPRYTGNRLVIT